MTIQIMQIIPSILENNPKNYIEQISNLSPFLNHFQIDIADGILVPNKTAQLKEILYLLTNNQQLTTNNHYDFHLMVSNPTTHIDYIEALKANIKIETIFIHYKALRYEAPFTHFVHKYSSVAQIGLVFNPEDDINTINSLIPVKTIPIVQIMTIDPGKQGNPFLVESLKKVEQLRSLGYRNKIAVDGGVNIETIQLMISQKQIPDIICPGSYFSKAKSEELKERVKKMKQVISNVIPTKAGLPCKGI